MLEQQIRTGVEDDALVYDAEYYQHGCGSTPYERNSHWLGFFCGIATELVRSLRPKRVFDAGCAWGFLVEAFWDLGVEAYGVDISSYAIDQVRRDMRSCCRVGSLVEPIQGTYDLVTCIEVLEHMPEEEAKEAVRQMTEVTDSILFSSTPNDFTEPTHVNVHPPIYWLNLFAKHHFAPDLLYDAAFLSPHAFLLRRQKEPIPEDVLILFNEMLKYKIAFITRQARIEELEGERQSFCQRITDAQSQLEQSQKAAIVAELSNQELAEQNAELHSYVTSLKQKATLDEEKLRILERDYKQIDALKQKAALDEEKLRVFEHDHKEIDNLKQIVAQSEMTLEEWGIQNAELTYRVENLQAELQSVYTSPGWRLIRRYREWFHSQYWRHAWFRKSFEPAVLWGLRKMNIANNGEVTRSAAVLRSNVPSGSTAWKSILANRKTARPLDSTDELSGSSESGDYQDWILQNEPTESQLEIQRRLSACFAYRPKISVLVPVYKVPQTVLGEMVESVRTQTYDDWELCLAHADAENREQREYLTTLSKADKRIKLKPLDANKGISGNSNEALDLATGEFLALLDHDDTLAPFALFEIVALLNEDQAANFIYSDKDQITEDSSHDRVNPLFKPAWSPETMLSANYLTHLCVMRTGHVREIGGWRKKTDGAQDWDLFLRIISRYGNVRHVPKVLYHWRRIATSVAAGGLEAKPYAAQSQVHTLQDFCREQGLPAEVAFVGGVGVRISWPPQPGCKVSIIYLSADPGPQTLAAAEELLARTDFPDMEILVPLSGRNTSASLVKVVQISAEATMMERIDRAIHQSSGQILAFVDETVTPDGPAWLNELAGPLANPDIGITGSKLVDPNTRQLRHCGLVFTGEGRLEYIYAGYPEHVCEAFGAANWYRNWSAVSGACFAIRREVWMDTGGLSGTGLHPRLDVHLCLKVGQAGKRIVYNPFARLYQTKPAVLEQPLWKEDNQSMDHLRSYFPDGDPFFNPNLTCHNGQVHFKSSSRLVASPPRGNDYAAESHALVQTYDFSQEQVRHSKALCATPQTGRMDRITWFLPDFVNPFYGGVHTILRFADSFRRNYNVHSLFCMIAHGPPSRFRQQIGAAFPELAANCEIAVIDGYTRVHELPASDAAVASLWSTAYAVLNFQNTRRKFYFIQDDEPLFYPAGSASALVEATYGFGFTGICNTVTLRDRYAARGGDCEYFTPCVDKSIFNAFGRKSVSNEKPYTLFCYGRPGHPRNCFELLSTVLRMLKAHLGDQVLILNAGAPWDLHAYGLTGIVENLGLLGYHSTGALYRMCDAGLVMMMTRHPSYLPLELMACGSLVITNRNPDTSWLLKDGENCLLADGSPTSIIERVEEGLRNTALRSRITDTARVLIDQNYSDWQREINKIYHYMLSQC